MAVSSRDLVSYTVAQVILDLSNDTGAAKSALDLSHVKIGVLYTDFIYISQYIISTWQDDWNGAVKLVLGDWQSSNRWCRKDEVVLCPACISHTHLTHLYILKKDHPPLPVCSGKSHFGGVQSSCSNNQRYNWKRCGGII